MDRMDDTLALTTRNKISRTKCHYDEMMSVRRCREFPRRMGFARRQQDAQCYAIIAVCRQRRNRGARGLTLDKARQTRRTYMTSVKTQGRPNRKVSEYKAFWQTYIYACVSQEQQQQAVCACTPSTTRRKNHAAPP
ncbi:unnamed protein product [Ectocarpus sp. 8 AP-2014]